MDSFIKESSRLTPTEASKHVKQWVALPCHSCKQMQSLSDGWLWNRFFFPTGLKLRRATGPASPCERSTSIRITIPIPWRSTAFASPKPITSMGSSPLSRPNTLMLPIPGFSGDLAVNLGELWRPKITHSIQEVDRLTQLERRTALVGIMPLWCRNSSWRTCSPTTTASWPTKMPGAPCGGEPPSPRCQKQPSSSDLAQPLESSKPPT